MTGMLGLLLVHAKNLSNYVKENIVLNIIMNEGVSEGNVLAYQKELESDNYVLRSEYISKELAAENLSKELGEDFVEFLGHNPLLSSIDVYLKAEYANTDSRSEEHTSELQSLMRISYAVFCLKKKN